MLKKETEKFNDSNIFEGMSSISALIRSIENKTNDRKIIKILFSKDKIKSKHRELCFLKSKSEKLNFDIFITFPEEIDQMTIGNTHGGIIAECSDRSLPALSSENIKDFGVYFILDGVEDPYNFGYAVRSLYAAGVDGIILNERNWMGAAGVVARSSAGTSELINMYVSDPINAMSLFKEKNYKIICAGIRDSISIFDADLSKPLLVILGGEKRGISRNILECADQICRIDYGSEFGGSLSTSAASAIFAFEIFRFNRKI